MHKTSYYAPFPRRLNFFFVNSGEEQICFKVFYEGNPHTETMPMNHTVPDQLSWSLKLLGTKLNNISIYSMFFE